VNKLTLTAVALLLAAAPLSASTETEGLRDLTIGEEYAYSIAWNGIPVGVVDIEVSGITTIRGRDAYIISCSARTNPWAAMIYKVEDSFTTYIDRETSNSLKHEIVRAEGNYRKKAVVEYLYGRFLAEYTYPKSGEKKTVDVSGDIHDPLSAIFYFFRKKVSPGDRLTLNIDLNEKAHTLYTTIKNGKRVRVPGLGTFNTLSITPQVKRKGKPYKRGSGIVYVSRDDFRPLFAMASVFPWGRFSATLLPPR